MMWWLHIVLLHINLVTASIRCLWIQRSTRSKTYPWKYLFVSYKMSLHLGVRCIVVGMMQLLIVMYRSVEVALWRCQSIRMMTARLDSRNKEGARWLEMSWRKWWIITKTVLCSNHHSKQRATKNFKNICFIVSGGGLHYRGETNEKHDFEEV